MPMGYVVTFPNLTDPARRAWRTLARATAGAAGRRCIRRPAPAQVPAVPGKTRWQPVYVFGMILAQRMPVHSLRVTADDRSITVRLIRVCPVTGSAGRGSCIAIPPFQFQRGTPYSRTLWIR